MEVHGLYSISKNVVNTGKSSYVILRDCQENRSRSKVQKLIFVGSGCRRCHGEYGFDITQRRSSYGQILGSINPLIKFCLISLCQYVSYNGFSSPRYSAIPGVPQGSNTGPQTSFRGQPELLRRISSWSDCPLVESDLLRPFIWCRDDNLLHKANKFKSMSFARNRKPFISIMT